MKQQSRGSLSLIIGILCLCVFAGILFFLNQFETARASDMQRMSVIMTLKSSLAQFGIDRAGFPVSPSGPFALGVTPFCLSVEGFSPLSTDSCAKRTYATIPHLNQEGVFAYRALMEDGTTSCTSTTSCPNFSVDFSLESNGILKKGMHQLTPQGIR